MPDARDAILAIIAKAVGALDSVTSSQLSMDDKLDIAHRIMTDLNWGGFKILKSDDDVIQKPD